ncbi:MAG: YfcE family phosphodiesterase [Phycisphaerae bacterium]|nr:YfcE family phosphodiesterase [Phycisphaerae bacterium]
MIIGIVSDTHGQIDSLRSALEIFSARGVQAVVHCGDIDSAECLEALAGLGVPTYAVGGNMDANLTDLPRLADIAGVVFSWDSLAFSIGQNTCVAVTHGHNPRVMADLMENPANKFLFHGHTHCQRDEHVERGDRAAAIHVINPGALHKPKSPTHPTVAVLDTDRDVVEFLDVQP